MKGARRAITEKSSSSGDVVITGIDRDFRDGKSTKKARAERKTDNDVVWEVEESVLGSVVSEMQGPARSRIEIRGKDGSDTEEASLEDEQRFEATIERATGRALLTCELRAEGKLEEKKYLENIERSKRELKEAAKRWRDDGEGHRMRAYKKIIIKQQEEIRELKKEKERERKSKSRMREEMTRIIEGEDKW